MVKIDKVHAINITVIFTRDVPGITTIGAEQGAVGVVTGHQLNAAEAGVAHLHRERIIGQTRKIDTILTISRFTATINHDAGLGRRHVIDKGVVVSQRAVNKVDLSKGNRAHTIDHFTTLRLINRPDISTVVAI